VTPASRRNNAGCFPVAYVEIAPFAFLELVRFEGQ
jgi:hypothetical protein